MNQDYLGFGYLDTPEEIVPPVATTYYSFHVMVYLGTFFLLLTLLYLYYSYKDTLEDKKWLLVLGI